MSELSSYAILGRGRWATVMQAILAAESRRVVLIEDTRRRNSESEDNYISRLGELLDRSGARIAWLCVPPGPHVPAMLKASIAAGLNAVIEKPWLCSEAETESLLALAGERRLLLAVHYQYCLLDEVERWRRDFNQGAGLCFSGRFTLRRGDRLGIPALHNLGSHLLAIRAYAVPFASISEIQCGYDQPDRREVWLEAARQRISSTSFFPTREPVIQRFIGRLETALDTLDFPFDLRFARRVADDIAAYEQRWPAGKLT